MNTPLTENQLLLGLMGIEPETTLLGEVVYAVPLYCREDLQKVRVEFLAENEVDFANDLNLLSRVVDVVMSIKEDNGDMYEVKDNRINVVIFRVGEHGDWRETITLCSDKRHVDNLYDAMVQFARFKMR